MKKLIAAVAILAGLTGCGEEYGKWVQIKGDPIIQVSVKGSNGATVNAQFLLNQLGTVSFRILIPDVCDKATDIVETTPMRVEDKLIRVWEMCNGKDIISFPQTEAGNNYIRQKFANQQSVMVGTTQIPTKGLEPLYNRLVNYKDSVGDAI
ncbi:hypothetical protein GLP30_17015 [Photobacterium phosphoreum]|uniref:Uncharacterized protein n=1 Tax=Photobacterium phosphoreum TaxID=659 RepID=A0AAW4ZWJ2_PHOPO|nr:hypothetical protein [Photobacterium phosphoreum]MCD9492646.1 hypothetical protein [Photobacterium phosphoreum]MCF2191789.1 hypothetical protein [Photobacterium phosphoreum]MCF2303477.1 hypothetical protein [Photobacterium phosphoreum]